MDIYEKPLPQPTSESKEFWEGCKRDELLVQKCKDCGTLRYMPRPMCHVCNSLSKEWIKVSGRGKIFSWIVVNWSSNAGLAKEVPYVVIAVTLSEQNDLRMIGKLEDCSPEDVKADMPVEVFFERITEEITLPKWKPIKQI